MDINKYFWTCPNCGARVDGIRQIADGLFDETGEANFDPAQGAYVHTISCPECGLKWLTGIDEPVKHEQ